MSVLRDSVTSLCVFWLLFCGEVFCDNDATQESRSMEMLFRQAHDIGTILADIKKLLMLVPQIEAISQKVSKLEQGKLAMMEKIETLQSELHNDIAVKMNVTEAKIDLISKRVVTEGCGGNLAGLSTISVTGSEITVPCDGQGRIVIMRRVDGRYNFPERNWDEYKNGFGDLEASFWIGLEKIHRLTSPHSATLRVELEAFDGETRWAEYSRFRVEGEDQKYRLRVSNYTGTAGDSLTYHDGKMFSTKDHDNDDSSRHCAERWKGAWWYYNCHYSNLNSVYFHNGTVSEPSMGLIWRTWKGWEYSYKTVAMKIRVHV